MNAKTEPKISRRRPCFFYFSFCWSSPLNLWAKSDIRTIRFRRASPGNKYAPSPGPRARLVPQKKVNGQDENFFLGLLTEDEGKISLCPPNIFLPPSHATLEPGLNYAKQCFQPSKHCIVGPMLARCSCQHLLTSAPPRQPMLGRCGFAPKSSVQPTLAFCSGPTSQPASANNGGIMFPTSARSWQTAANQHRNCSLANIELQTAANNIGSCVAPTMAE